MPTDSPTQESLQLSTLKPHPRNYRAHPPEQLEHIKASILQHGLYRNVVCAKDLTILAGHGVVEACRALGIDRVPVIRLDVAPDSPAALKLLAGDNEISNLAADNDRLLSELLREVSIADPQGLLGTGFGPDALAALVLVTRGRGEIADEAAASEWVGMPAFEPGDVEWTLTVKFANEADREAFYERAGLAHEFIVERGDRKHSTLWPQQPRQDLSSLRSEAKQ